MTELAYRYTEEKYCSKKEVSKHLSVMMIDPVWQSILEYRKPYIKKINVDFEIYFCLCSSLCLRMLNIRQNYNSIKENIRNDYSIYLQHLKIEKRNEVNWMFYHWADVRSDLTIMIHETFVRMNEKGEQKWISFLTDPTIILEIKWITLFQQELSRETAMCLFIALCLHYDMASIGTLISDVIFEKSDDLDKTYLLQNVLDILETRIQENTMILEDHSQLDYQTLQYKYPQLKSYQIKFYIQHHTQGHFYTIEQFMENSGVCYETARTSLDQLVSLQFYDKIKQGKKFIYTKR